MAQLHSSGGRNWNWHGWSIRTKFVSLAVTVTFLCGILAHLIITESARRHQLDQIAVEAVRSARQVAFAAASLASLHEPNDIRVLMGALALDVNISGAALYDLAGNRIGSIGSDAGAFPGFCPLEPELLISGKTMRVTTAITDGRRTVGCMILVRGLESFDAQMAQVRRSAFIVLPAFTILVGLGLKWLLDHVVCHPLARLRTATAAVGDGYFPDPVLIAYPDEIGALAKDFNAMLERLRSAHENQTQLITSLEQRTAEANAAAQIKGEFLANVSHELRTPLNGMLGMTDLLLETGLDAEQREFTQHAKVAASRLLEMVSEILQFSKAEDGRITPDCLPFDVREVARNAIREYDSEARDRGLTLLHSVDEEVPVRVRADPDFLHQVLAILIGNAVKFTSVGGVHLSVEMAAPTVLRFTVADTGIGIAGEMKPFLFHPFRQGDGSSTRKFGGIGIGLALCDRLVRLMGGEIGVESEPGRGSRFIFTIRATPDIITIPVQSAARFSSHPVAPSR